MHYLAQSTYNQVFCITLLDMSYCDSHRHSLRTFSSLLAYGSLRCRFPRVDAPEHVGYGQDIIEYEPRLSAYGCMNLYNAPSGGAVTGLSYPETSGFSECHAVQVSPRAPAASLRPHQPSCADPVPLLPYGPRASLPRFHSCQVHFRSRGWPFPRRPVSSLMLRAD